MKPFDDLHIFDKASRDSWGEWRSLTGSKTQFRTHGDSYFQFVGKIDSEEEVQALIEKVRIRLLALIEKKNSRSGGTFAKENHLFPAGSEDHRVLTEKRWPRTGKHRNPPENRVA